MTINKVPENTTNRQEESIGKSAEYYRNQLFPTLWLTAEDFDKHEVARNKLLQGGNSSLKKAIRPNTPEQE